MINTARNVVAATAFLLAARIMVISIRWLTDDGLRITAIKQIIDLGKIAQLTNPEKETSNE
jgi:hypothetical protein